MEEYKRLSDGDDGLESEVMRHTVVSKKQQPSMYMGELLLSALVLSCSPKSDQAWSHRRWVIKSIAGKRSALQEILGKESELVEKIAERSKMNYHAWNHRCWLVSYLTREQRLILRILKDSKLENASPGYSVEVSEVWKEELNWNERLIKRYIGREALWLHRRFLSLCWMKQFATNLHDVSCHSELKISTSNNFNSFIDNELHLFNSCSIVPENDFEDFRA
ncbi:protein prenyltransferase alpha subunit repeat-containing protein 1-B-like [Quercus lobata]|uniref:protein prenyltransferase alpha subunit repeat-containing protein 1-B-like n=1 Tax=Quercus lobata TaxID=97700 RepID=UPI001248184B|nr:protein prenyltransferase alpha subunit repeat-containing protein 1-B-like [Quercus lobata]